MRQVSSKVLAKLTYSTDLGEYEFDDFLAAIREDTLIDPFLPKDYVRTDPRNGERVLYSLARAKRPIRTKEEARAELRHIDSCPLCNGETTSFIDVTALSEGHTLINKNLFPAIYPHSKNNEAEPAFGMHFLQWSSTIHDRDIHNMPKGDCRIVIDRLALLEEKLLHSASSKEHKAYVGIIKNYGFLAGGSLSHGHQQIVYSNVAPRKIVDDECYLAKHSHSFADYLVKRNDESLTVASFGPVKAVTPYFMLRPLQTILLFQGAPCEYLHHLDDEQRDGLVEAFGKLLPAIIETMPEIGRLPCFNIVFHCGPIGRMYVEIHAYTQEIAGLEHLGLYVCQGTPEQSALMLRQAIKT